MPNKNTKKSRSKTKIIVFSVIGIAVLILIGAYAVREINKSIEIKNQQALLSQTLSGVSSLYDQFAVDTENAQPSLEEKPQNKCSEISAVYVKTYTCGTRADINYPNADEASFARLSEALRKDIDTSVFKVVKEDPVTESSLYNGQAMFISLIHQESGQTCYINGSYYREHEDYNDQAKIISYSFNCNLNSDYPIYPPES